MFSILRTIPTSSPVVYFICSCPTCYSSGLCCSQMRYRTFIQWQPAELCQSTRVPSDSDEGYVLFILQCALHRPTPLPSLAKLIALLLLLLHTHKHKVFMGFFLFIQTLNLLIGDNCVRTRTACKKSFTTTNL